MDSKSQLTRMDACSSLDPNNPGRRVSLTIPIFQMTVLMLTMFTAWSSRTRTWKQIWSQPVAFPVDQPLPWATYPFPPQASFQKHLPTIPASCLPTPCPSIAIANFGWSSLYYLHFVKSIIQDNRPCDLTYSQFLGIRIRTSLQGGGSIQPTRCAASLSSHFLATLHYGRLTATLDTVSTIITIFTPPNPQPSVSSLGWFNP